MGLQMQILSPFTLLFTLAVLMFKLYPQNRTSGRRVRNTHAQNSHVSRTMPDLAREAAFEHQARMDEKGWSGWGAVISDIS